MEKDTVAELRERIIRLEVREDHVEKSVDTLKERLISHMEREEHSFDKIQASLEKLNEKHGRMDKEITESFKERDDRIITLEKSVIKIFAYATGSFTAVSFLIQYIVRAV